jgi:hypothetical protein
MSALAAKRAEWSALITSVAASMGDALGTRVPASYVQSLVETMRQQVGCFDCGTREPVVALDLDHIDPTLKYRTATGRVVHMADMWKPSGDGRTRYALRTIFAELAKCDVRCSNCHRARTFPEARPRSFDPAMLQAEDRRALLDAHAVAGGSPGRILEAWRLWEERQWPRKR